MNFLEPANLAWSFVVPVLVLFYFMKLKRRQVTVPAAFLWQRAARQARVDSFFQKLRVNLLLLLQLLALAALLLALARPYSVAPGRAASQVALVLDISASMQAGDRFEKAREKAFEIVRRAPRGAEFLVATVGRQLKIEHPFDRDPDAVRSVLARLQPVDVEGDLKSLPGLILSTVGSKPQAQVFLLGDSLPEGLEHPQFRFFGFGEATPNLALAGFNLTRSGESLLVFGVLESQADSVESRTVSLYRGQQLIESREWTVPARGRRTLLLEVPMEGADTFELRLSPGDGLAVDDQAFAVIPPSDQVKVASLARNAFLERAVQAVPGVELYRLEEYRPGYDLYLWKDREEHPGLHLATTLPASWSPVLVPGRHSLSANPGPLTRALPWDSLSVSGVHRVKLPDSAQVLVTASDFPALIRRDKTFFFNFDLLRSNLPLSPVLPILMARLIELEARPESALFPAQTTAGKTVHWRGQEPLLVTTPKGDRLEVTDRFQPLDTGFYQMGDKPLAVNLFSPTESALGDPPADVLGASPAQAGSSQSLAEEWWWHLGGLALLLLIGEWFLFHHREGL